ncbi:MAG: LptF/LptG family permease [Fuerstia sp.]|nr:LptF/LptG family permease [Fuerstiella sp.]
MKLLQRYILGELVRVFVLLVVVLTVMLVFVGVFQEASARGLGPTQILQILPYVVPSMLPFTIPATLLLSVCVVYGRISGDLEVIAAKSAGISAMQLLLPAFLLGTVLAIGSFGLLNYAIPWGVSNIERIVIHAAEEIFFDVLRTQYYFSNPNEGYTITVRDVKNRTLLDATIRYRRNHQQYTVCAEAARLRFDLNEKEILVHLKNVSGGGAGSDFSGEMKHSELRFPLEMELAKVVSRNLTMDTLRQEIVRAEIDQERLATEKNIEATMLLFTGDLQQLASEEISELDKQAARAVTNGLKYRAEIHNRFSMSASCWFFAFLGGPFAMLQARRQFITSFIICFLPILIIYYPVMFLMLNLCKSGTLDPWWAMWVPNMIIGSAGFLVLRKVLQH